jgi:mono/diheme cytochrome c family protein
MNRSISVMLFLLAAAPQAALAQQAGDALNDQQRLGRIILAQNCGVCHLPTNLNAKTYGPPLNKSAASGDNEIMREYILNGTPRMPAFKYMLQPNEIDAVIAYVRSVPVPGAPAR